MTDRAAPSLGRSDEHPTAVGRRSSQVEITDRRDADDAANVQRLRVSLGDGKESTVHVARYVQSAVTVRLVRLDPPQPIAAWSRASGIREVMSGGFFAKPEHVPLGELHLRDGEADHRPFRRPWDERRGALWLQRSTASIAPRSGIRIQRGEELLQAGPILVKDGRALCTDDDPEGFRATCDEFDQDITADRLPRMAIALADPWWLAVAS